MRHIDYYQASISKSSFDEALSDYLDYMKAEGLKPELTQDDYDAIGFEDLEETIISHVVYHADLGDFDSEEHLVS